MYLQDDNPKYANLFTSCFACRKLTFLVNISETKHTLSCSRNVNKIIAYDKITGSHRKVS